MCCILKMFNLIRVDKDSEIDGLDLKHRHEEAYPEIEVKILAMDSISCRIFPPPGLYFPWPGSWKLANGKAISIVRKRGRSKRKAKPKRSNTRPSKRHAHVPAIPGGYDSDGEYSLASANSTRHNNHSNVISIVPTIGEQNNVGLTITPISRIGKFRHSSTSMKDRWRMRSSQGSQNGSISSSRIGSRRASIESLPSSVFTMENTHTTNCVENSYELAEKSPTKQEYESKQTSVGEWLKTKTLEPPVTNLEPIKSATTITTPIDGDIFLNFQVKDVQSDGNCLFRAFSTLLYASEQEHVNLRAKCCAWLTENENLMDDFFARDLGDDKHSKFVLFGNNYCFCHLQLCKHFYFSIEFVETLHLGRS